MFKHARISAILSIAIVLIAITGDYRHYDGHVFNYSVPI